MIIFPSYFIFSRIGLAGSRTDGVECLDELVEDFYRDVKHVLSSPFRWSQHDLVLLSTLSATTLTLMITDTDFQESVQKNRTSTSDEISKWTDKCAKRVGNLTIGGLYLSGLVLHDRKAKRTALLCLESVALAEGITKGLKYLVGRSRPYGDKGAFNFDPLKLPPPSYSLSFPSGHATSAFALSSVIAEQYRSWPVWMISYGFALVVSLARVNNNAHFLSDVFWGAVVGISVGRCLVRFNEANNRAGWKIAPINISNDFGIKVSIWLK